MSFGEQLRRTAAGRGPTVAIVFVAADGAHDELTWAELDPCERGRPPPQDRASASTTCCRSPCWPRVARRRGVRGVEDRGQLPAALGQAAGARARGDVARRRRPVRHRRRPPLGRPRGAPRSVHDRPRRQRARARRGHGRPYAPARRRRPPAPILFGSGGSTGQPKIVNSYGAGAKVPGRTLPVGRQLGQRPGQRVLVTSPTYHTMGFSSTYLSLFEDRRPIAMERFEAGFALR